MYEDSCEEVNDNASQSGPSQVRNSISQIIFKRLTKGCMFITHLQLCLTDSYIHIQPNLWNDHSPNRSLLL